MTGGKGNDLIGEEESAGADAFRRGDDNPIGGDFDADGTEGSGDGTAHPVETGEMGPSLPGGVAGRGGLDAQEVATEQIDGTGSPGMAERLAVGATVHREVFVALHLGIVLLPERRGTFAQHATPIGLDFGEYFVVQPQLAECGKFVEAHVGRGDGGHCGVLHDMLKYLLLTLLVGIAVEDGEHAGELRDLRVKRG